MSPEVRAIGLEALLAGDRREHNGGGDLPFLCRCLDRRSGRDSKALESEPIGGAKSPPTPSGARRSWSPRPPSDRRPGYGPEHYPQR